MRPAKNLFVVAVGVVRLVAVAADVACRRVVAASCGSADAIDQMNPRQLQDVGLSRTRLPSLKDDFEKAETQLGMVR